MASVPTQTTHKPLVLPYISLQPSTGAVVADIEAGRVAAEDCWVSVVRGAAAEATPGGGEHDPSGSVHGRFRVSEGDDEGSIEVESRDDKVVVNLVNKSDFTVSCPSLAIPPTSVLLPPSALNTAPSTSYSTNSASQEEPAPALLRFPVRGGIECFALSGDGKRVVVGGRDGQARVVEVVRFEDAYAAQAKGKRLAKGRETALRGHVGDLTAVEFFPSSEVVLTASSDMSLRLFSAADGSSPRELKSHTKRVTGLHILCSSSPSGPHKGRLVLSSSLDGTLNLWDVAAAEVRQTWVLPQPVSALEVFSAVQGEEDAEDVLKSKFALAAHTDGTISLIDLASPTAPSFPAFKTSAISSLDCISTLSFADGRRAIAVGGRNSVVSLFVLPVLPLSDDAQKPLQPLAEWRRTEGGTQIHSLQLSSRLSTSASPSSPSAKGSILVASSDGLAYRATVALPEADGEAVKVEVEEEFVGPDCEPVTGIREDGEGRVWISAGGADGGLRVYERET
ncbi:hypothetical protein JCM10213_007595 [Rhodosporidiobolus nylandii]